MNTLKGVSVQLLLTKIAGPSELADLSALLKILKVLITIDKIDIDRKLSTDFWTHGIV